MFQPAIKKRVYAAMLITEKKDLDNGKKIYCHSDRSLDFSVIIPRCYKDVCQQFLSSHS